MVSSEMSNKFVIRLDDFATEVCLKGDSEWQQFLLQPSDFRNAEDCRLNTWIGLKELCLGYKETIKSDTVGSQPVTLGGEWQGNPPEFRLLRWVIEDPIAFECGE
jgi:hypothetical protein